MTHAADLQLTYIRALDQMTRQNIKDMIHLARTLRDSFRNLSLQLNRAEADLLDTQEAIEKQVKYSAAIREIEMAILELKFSMMQLQEPIDVTRNGILTFSKPNFLLPAYSPALIYFGRERCWWIACNHNVGLHPTL
jgi:hypothetical protein